ncbi:hypothetical protein CRUP_013756 [Coryphaenoides rupestris]|nr:hypothetical protein CRUP_013756 [Coryphaenoides rupestris]
MVLTTLGRGGGVPQKPWFTQAPFPTRSNSHSTCPLRVSYLDSFLSWPHWGTTLRRQSKAVFRPSIRFLSRALAAILLRVTVSNFSGLLQSISDPESLQLASRDFMSPFVIGSSEATEPSSVRSHMAGQRRDRSALTVSSLILGKGQSNGFGPTESKVLHNPVDESRNKVKVTGTPSMARKFLSFLSNMGAIHRPVGTSSWCTSSSDSSTGVRSRRNSISLNNLCSKCSDGRTELRNATGFWMGLGVELLETGEEASGGD